MKVSRGCEMYRVIMRLKEMKQLLKQLNKDYYSNLQERTDQAKTELDMAQHLLQSDPFNRDLQSKEHEARQKYIIVHKLLLAQLKQQTKIRWAEEGDENTAFFHTIVSQRHRGNQIHMLRNETWEYIEDKEKLKEHIVNFYADFSGETTSSCHRLLGV